VSQVQDCSSGSGLFEPELELKDYIDLLLSPYVRFRENSLSFHIEDNRGLQV
jgi:hypothetical protein